MRQKALAGTERDAKRAMPAVFMVFGDIADRVLSEKVR